MYPCSVFEDLLWFFSLLLQHKWVLGVSEWLTPSSPVGLTVHTFTHLMFRQWFEKMASADFFGTNFSRRSAVRYNVFFLVLQWQLGTENDSPASFVILVFWIKICTSDVMVNLFVVGWHVPFLSWSSRNRHAELCHFPGVTPSPSPSSETGHSCWFPQDT